MRTSLTLLLLLSLAGGEAHAGGWTQFLDKNGVRGYTRTVPGSNLVDVRSTIVVPAKIEIVGAVLRDVEGLKRSGSSCIEVRIIEKRDRNHYTFYVAYDFPWPVSDRDAVVKVTTRYDLNKARVDMLISDEEMAARRAAYKPPVFDNHTPWQEIYRNDVGQLETGGVLESAVKYQRVRNKTPRHSH